MMTRTRYFVIASLSVLTVGLGTGLVAYYVGFPAGAFAGRGGPEELRYVPRDAAVIAYANVQDVMVSDLRQKLHKAIGPSDDGQREFQERTGINIETDIDRVVACLDPSSNGTGNHAGMVLARGRFDAARIESLMREHGAHVEDYTPRGASGRDASKRLIVADVPDHPGAFALAFIEPGLVAVGSTNIVRNAIDLHQGGDNPQTGVASATNNDELMTLVHDLEGDNNVWAVGRFDSLIARAKLPSDMASRIPAITVFSVGAHINGGLRGVLRADTRDEEAANNLRDVVRGFMGLAKLQAGSRPEMQAMLQSLSLGGTGKTVAISFTVPSEVFDAVAAMAPNNRRQK